MIKVYYWFEDSKLDVLMIMQVYDELVFEVKESQVDDLVKEVIQCMEVVVKLDVLLIVDVGIGNNWEEVY